MIIITITMPWDRAQNAAAVMTLALEIGYTESYDELQADADLLLEGSQGKIRVVILVKVDPLGPNDTHWGAGFVEVHEYDPISGTRKKRGRRKVFSNAWLLLCTILPWIQGWGVRRPARRVVERRPTLCCDLVSPTPVCDSDINLIEDFGAICPFYSRLRPCGPLLTGRPLQLTGTCG
jgi:hypothetical protein